MANKIQFKRGLKVSLPTLSEAEPGFCTDTKEIFIGSSGGNVGIVNKETFDKHLADRTKNLIINGGLELKDKLTQKVIKSKSITAIDEKIRLNKQLYKTMQNLISLKSQSYQIAA